MLAPLYPLDRKKNAEGLRRRIGVPGSMPEKTEKSGEFPPLLQKIMAEYAASGLPPAYIVDSKPHGGSEEDPTASAVAIQEIQINVHPDRQDS